MEIWEMKIYELVIQNHSFLHWDEVKDLFAKQYGIGNMVDLLCKQKGRFKYSITNFILEE